MITNRHAVDVPDADRILEPGDRVLANVSLEAPRLPAFVREPQVDGWPDGWCVVELEYPSAMHPSGFVTMPTNRVEHVDDVWTRHFARCAQRPGMIGNDVCNVWD